MFLMGFGGEHNHGEPAREVRECADPSGIEEACQLVCNECRFVDAIAWWTTGNRVCGIGVDAKFIVTDRSQCAASGKRVPVPVDDVS